MQALHPHELEAMLAEVLSPLEAEFASEGLTVKAYPTDPTTFSREFQDTSVHVGFQGIESDRFEAASHCAPITAMQSHLYEVVIRYRDLRRHDGALLIQNRVIALIQGLRPNETAFPFVLRRAGPVALDRGRETWVYAAVFALRQAPAYSETRVYTPLNP